MKELTIEQKARAYDRAKDIMEKYLKSGNAGVIAENTIKNAFPELHENENEIIKEELINYLKFRCNSTTLSGEERACNKWIDWLEKQGEKKPILDFNADDWYVSKVDGKIYNAKFIEQDSYKKIRRKEIEKAAFSTSGIIEQTDWFIKGAEWADEHPCCNWLEKQGTPKQVSIWKHWKDGIAGNGEGKPIYLVKIGNTYSLKSCLGFECDYIELSELDNLMLEKQGEQTDKIVERAKTEKQRVLITESDGEANIDWDTRSLQDVKLLLEYGLDYINKLDEKNCLSNTKPSMGDLKIISSLKDIIYGYWNSLPDSALEENEVAESCYRWLEKQCEQNLVNKVEPKFHKGD